MTPDNINQQQLSWARLQSLLAEDVGVTSVEDGHGGAAEELTASGTELDLLQRKRNEVSSTVLPSRENRSLLLGVEEAIHKELPPCWPLREKIASPIVGIYA